MWSSFGAEVSAGFWNTQKAFGIRVHYGVSMVELSGVQALRKELLASWISGGCCLVFMRRFFALQLVR